MEKNKLNKMLLTLVTIFDLGLIGIVFWKFGSRMPTITLWSLVLTAAAVSGFCITFLTDESDPQPRSLRHVQLLLLSVGFAVVAAGWALKG